MIVVLGASGYIGSYLFNGLKKQGLDVRGTYFRNRKEGLLYFNLEDMGLNELGFDAKKVDYVIISAAANTKIDDTKIHWDNSYYVNVTKTKGIIDYCFQNDIVPIYISTDNVFDGNKGKYNETDERNPVNCYGRIRYEVENYMIGADKTYVILRVGKVFGIKIEDNTLLTTMVENLRTGKKIRCAIDQIFTPVYIDDLVNFVKDVINNDYKGTFHLGSTKPVSRHAIAIAIQRHLKLKADNIIPCKIDSLGLLDKRPRRIDLDISKYKEIAGYQEEEIEHYLSLIG